MSAEDFNKCLRFVLDAEGGYTDDPNDPGGPTNMGITERELLAFRDAGHPDFPADVRSLTVQQAGEIYRVNYWDRMQCDDHVWPIDAVLFDCAVNQGPAFAGSCLAQAKTLCGPAAPPMVIAKQMIDLRMQRYDRIVQANPHLTVFLHGWENRLAALKAFIVREQLGTIPHAGNTPLRQPNAGSYPQPPYTPANP